MSSSGTVVVGFVWDSLQEEGRMSSKQCHISFDKLRALKLFYATNSKTGPKNLFGIICVFNDLLLNCINVYTA